MRRYDIWPGTVTSMIKRTSRVQFCMAVNTRRGKLGVIDTQCEKLPQSQCALYVRLLPSRARQAAQEQALASNCKQPEHGRLCRLASRITDGTGKWFDSHFILDRPNAGREEDPLHKPHTCLCVEAAGGSLERRTCVRHLCALQSIPRVSALTA